MDMMAPKFPAGKEGAGPGTPCSFQYFHFPHSHQYPRPNIAAQRRVASKNITESDLVRRGLLHRTVNAGLVASGAGVNIRNLPKGVQCTSGRWTIGQKTTHI